MKLAENILTYGRNIVYSYRTMILLLTVSYY